MYLRQLRMLMAVAAAVGMAHTAIAGVVIHTEDFEDDTGFTTSDGQHIDAGVGGADFFKRTDGSDISLDTPVTGVIGNFFFAAQDIDDNGAFPDSQSVTLDPINISGFSNLSFSGFFAETDDSNPAAEDWDSTDFVHVNASIDGSPFFPVLWFENDENSGVFNQVALQDTDFDGIGDGAELINDLTQFTAPISGTGNSLVIQVEVHLNAGDEDVAFDQFVITPEPSTLCLVALSGIAVVRRRSNRS